MVFKDVIWYYKNIMNYIKRFLDIPQQSFFLFGPRGTGKTTWLAENFPNALKIDLLLPNVLRTYIAKPERLLDLVAASTQTTIIIDEVQKAPELLSVVHSLIESKIAKQFILTGSSARKLKRTGVNLLAGRAISRHLHPFIATELGDNFNLDTALKFGLVPLVCASVSPVDTLKAYIGLYLREEIQSEGLVRNLGDFARFLEVISFSHATVLNVSNVARECEISRKTIEGYLGVLEDLLLSFTLPIFSKRAKRELVKHEKFYLFDAGVFRSLRLQGPLDIESEINGITLEGLIAEHLRAWNDYKNTPNKIYYWRTSSGTEVDFIVYGANCFWAIEVKNSKIIAPKDLRGLKTFCEDYPEATPLLLYRGSEKLRQQDILCMPVEEFLLKLDPRIEINLLDL
jgi:predicted AAA+ superfamily ATPase